MSLLAPRYFGTELPIYSRDRHKLTNRKLAKFVSGATIIRPVRIQCRDRLAERGIGAVLDQADAEFKRVAELCGAMVIHHRWGLYPMDHEDELRYAIYRPNNIDKLRIPSRHLLVAEVDVLRDAHGIPSDSEQGQQILEGLLKYEHSSWARHLVELRNHGLRDMGLGQFAFGQTDMESPSTACLPKLLDVEPRLR